MKSKLWEAMVAAGWDQVCAAVRAAGHRAISEPGARARLAESLRRVADVLDRKGGGGGVFQQDEEAAGGGGRAER